MLDEFQLKQIKAAEEYVTRGYTLTKIDWSTVHLYNSFLKNNALQGDNHGVFHFVRTCCAAVSNFLFNSRR